MDELTLSILKEISEGKKNFAPNTRSKKDVDDFQDIANRIIWLEQKGFIGKVSSIVSRMVDTHGKYLNVMVVKGITYDGERYMNDASERYNNDVIVNRIKNKLDILNMNVNKFLSGLPYKVPLIHSKNRLIRELESYRETLLDIERYISINESGAVGQQVHALLSSVKDNINIADTKVRWFVNTGRFIITTIIAIIGIIIAMM